MNASQLLTFQADEIIFRKVINKALSYALLSFPFTVNRMQLSNLSQRITNIVKGKIAEGLLQAFAQEKGFDLDFSAGETPFYKPDHFDFSFKGIAWDVKNNFIYHEGNQLDADRYLKLPALVPNRFDGDQWSKRNNSALPAAESPLEKAFLFTYMKQADERKTTAFMRIHFTPKVIAVLEKVVKSVVDAHPDKAPYTPEEFLDKVGKAGGIPGYIINNIPLFIIAGAASRTEWKLFADTDGVSEHAYHQYTGRWYDVRDDGGLIFCGGLLHTKIRNATCPVGFLPAFSEFLSQ